jgi:hypothetical protein
VVSSGSGGGELAPMMFDHIQKAWGSNEWYPAYAQIAGIREGNSDARGVWIAFERLLSFVPGKLVHHPGGWGVGEVKNLHAEALEIDVQFGSGKKDRFPLSAAVEIEVERSGHKKARRAAGPWWFRWWYRRCPHPFADALSPDHGGDQQEPPAGANGDCGAFEHPGSGHFRVQ